VPSRSLQRLASLISETQGTLNVTTDNFDNDNHDDTPEDTNKRDENGRWKKGISGSPGGQTRAQQRMIRALEGLSPEAFAALEASYGQKLVTG
jgi:hypothetical protein